ncbi:MAG TPA: 6-carboxytetrahydropterin synthase [Ignavibacteria bacterium]|nr:6-carboxytetrahydropterin synthase [Ignavibacteria bacterium]
MIYITRKEHFSASHVLKNDNLDESDNSEIFGKCNNIHGHNYYVEIKLKGEIDPLTGFIYDLKKLKTLIHSEIIEKVDHRFLNETEIMKGINPTAENIALTFFNILKEKINSDKVRLHSVKLFETDKNIAEVTDGTDDK